MLTAERLMSLGAIPKDMEVVRDFKNSCIAVSDFLRLSMNERKANKKIICVDNAVWVSKNRVTGITYSNDGSDTSVGRTNARGKQFIVQKLVNDKLATTRLVELFKEDVAPKVQHNEEPVFNIQAQDETIKKVEEQMPSIKDQNTKQNEEDNKMAEINLESLEGLSPQELALKLQGDATPKPMTQFDGKPEDVKEKAQDETTKKLQAFISSNIEGVELADNTDLSIFNRKHGRLVSYVTMNDRVTKFGTKSTPQMDESKKKMLVSNAPQEVRDAHNAGKGVDSKWYVKQTVLVIKEAAPGKVLGVVIGIPAGGFVDFSAFRNGSRVEFDPKNTAVKYNLYPKDESYQMLSFYFNNTIKEEARTHNGVGDGEIRLELKPIPKQNKETLVEETVIRPKLVPSNRKSVLLAGNYFPVKVYETKNANANLKVEDYEALNVSSFIHLYQVPTKAGAEGVKSPKIEALAPTDAAKISRTSAGKIESSFFTADVSKRLPIEVRAFYNKDEVLSTVEVPIKEEKQNKDKPGSTWRYKTYSCVAKDAAENAEYASKTSLQNGRFDVVLESTDGAINADSLKSLTRRAPGAGGTSSLKTLSVKDSKALMMKSLTTGLTGISFEGAKSKLDYTEISNMIASVNA